MPGHTHPIPVLNKIIRSGSFVSRTKRVTQIYNPTLATREFSRKTKVTTTQARIRSSFVEKHSNQIISLGEKPCTQISRYIENISVTSPSASGCSLNWSNHRKHGTPSPWKERFLRLRSLRNWLTFACSIFEGGSISPMKIPGSDHAGKPWNVSRNASRFSVSRDERRPDK